MFDKRYLDETERKKRKWEEGPLKKSLEKFGIGQSPNRFYTPLDIRTHDFLKDVGFPGEYPFTTGGYPTHVPGNAPVRGGGHVPSGGGLVRPGRYSGYGTPEDTRDYYKFMISSGQTSGPNLAFDLPTQLGFDSDNPVAHGTVGKVGVAIDTLRDFETIYEAFTGQLDLDHIHSAFTINSMANIILAMYIAIAEGRGIPADKLRCTLQNDILKEFVARGTQVFPIRPSMRMVRDTIVYSVRYMPLMHPISITGYHYRESGASREQTLAFTLADAIAYAETATAAGLDVNQFLPRFSFLNFSGSLEMFKEIALRRAARRMWAKITRERLKAENPKNWIMREVGNNMAGNYTATVQRPLNNIIRAAIGGIAAALSGDIPTCHPPYDEPLQLGHSLEALQLADDSARIIMHEARLCDVIDPLAGSYYVESLTDEIEEKAWAIINKINEIGGMVCAIEAGWVQRQIAASSYQYQKEIETGKRIIVGVNEFVGPDEIEVLTTRAVPDLYDPVKRASAEERQMDNLAQVKRERDNQAAKAALARLKEAAMDETVNIIPPLMEAVKTYATVGEICATLKEVFGSYEPEEL
jgi:methylmalonyl-CoA mutase N-terminal domain/subunit